MLKRLWQKLFPGQITIKVGDRIPVVNWRGTRGKNKVLELVVTKVIHEENGTSAVEITPVRAKEVDGYWEG